MPLFRLQEFHLNLTVRRRSTFYQGRRTHARCDRKRETFCDMSFAGDGRSREAVHR